MIKKSLLVALVLLALYHFVYPRLGRNYYWIPGQQRANYLRAQKFVHDAPADAKVVVGSSMSNELSQEVFGPGYVKLTFPAGGSFTGLDIIAEAGKKPPMVLIESNTLLRDSDAGLLNDSTSGWRRKLRDASPIFKEEGRPSNFEVGFLNAQVKRVCSLTNKVLHGGRKPAPAVEKPLDPAVFADIMRVNREGLDKTPGAENLTTRTKRMGEIVDDLIASGTKCVFYEMPIDPSLKDLKEPAAVRAAMLERFPKAKYRWLELDTARAWKTTDGIHLSRLEADEVTATLAAATKE